MTISLFFMLKTLFGLSFDEKYLWFIDIVKACNASKSFFFWGYLVIIFGRVMRYISLILGNDIHARNASYFVHFVVMIFGQVIPLILVDLSGALKFCKALLSHDVWRWHLQLKSIFTDDNDNKCLTIKRYQYDMKYCY